MRINPQFTTLRSDCEPIGIVIADGGHVALPTRFSAFVWGSVPDTDIDSLPPIVLARDAVPCLVSTA